MKLTFVYKMEDDYWNDGLKRAIDVLGESWNVRKQNGYWKPYITDFILVWGAFGSNQDSWICDLPFKKGICVAGGLIDHPNVHKYDVVFVETKWHQREFRKIGINAKVAFGTNTDLFYNMGMPRTIDYLYPAAFALWKRHEKFLEHMGSKVAVGYIQPGGHEKECYERCIEHPETTVLPRVKPDVLAWLYNQAKSVAIPSTINGGGERTVLEALACGCEVSVASDNPKLRELLSTHGGGVTNHLDYAHALKEGIREVYEA